MEGFWLSITVTVKLQVANRPAVSVTLKVLVVVPTGKFDPLAIPPVCTKEATAQLSPVVGLEKATTAWHCPAAAFVVIGAGHVMEGFWLSITVTVKLHVANRPA